MTNEYVFQIPHKIMEQEVDGQRIYGVELQENPYCGIIISYGKVDFKENEASDHLEIKFDYEILRHNDEIYNQKEFENYIGDLLQEMIIYEMQRNNLIFTGGINENREDNLIESDSQ